MSLLWKLQVENAYLKKESSLYLTSIDRHMVNRYKRHIEEAHYAWLHPNIQKYYKLENPDYQLITITFDPDLFGEYNDPELEKRYIFHQLMEAINKGYFYSFVGCFEYQKNGTVHAHVAAHLAISWLEIYQFLKSKFTANPKNRYAVNFGEHKLTRRWLCYLNGCNYPEEEQTDHIFSFSWQHTLDDENWFIDKYLYNLENPSVASVDVDEGGTAPPQVDSIDKVPSESNEVTQTVSSIPRTIRTKIYMIQHYYDQIKDIEKTLPEKYKFNLTK